MSLLENVKKVINNRENTINELVELIRTAQEKSVCIIVKSSKGSLKITPDGIVIPAFLFKRKISEEKLWQLPFPNSKIFQLFNKVSSTSHQIEIASI
ncbi:MAG: hypothetical protein QXS37_05780 [Candidatus Aenigmatarchaeota archaeon]